MAKVTLLLDEYLIPEESRNDIKEILKNKAFDLEITEADTHAKGGMVWFPTDLIIHILELTAAGFIGAIGGDAYQKLKSLIKKLLSRSDQIGRGIDNAFLSFKHQDIDIYFEFNVFTQISIEDAFKALERDFENIIQELSRLIKANFESVIGSFGSITFIYDEDEDKWIISHFNKY